MGESFIDRGKALLDEAWLCAIEQSGPYVFWPALAAAVDRVFEGTEAGYQKAVVIQAAGKAADPTLDAHAMQKGAGRSRSWDAREFAKSVFVPWNQSAGCPFSPASDPYVSNPYRIPRFDTSVRAQRKKPHEFDAALTVLEMLESTDKPEDAFNNLVEVLYSLRRFIADRSVSYPLPSRASLSDTVDCVAGFTTAKSGGARLQAVVYALFHALRAQGMAYSDIRSRHVNASDKSSGSAGDVSFELDENAFAVEVKDRSLSRAELDGTIEKCRVANVREMLFVIRAPSLLDADFSQNEFKAECSRQFSSGLNVYVEPFDTFARTVLALLGEDGRRAFLEGVGTALSEQNADIKHKWEWASLVKQI